MQEEVIERYHYEEEKLSRLSTSVNEVCSSTKSFHNAISIGDKTEVAY